LFDDDICSIISVLVHVSCGTNTALNDINGQSFRIVPMWWSFQVLCRLPNTTKCHNFHFLGRVPEKRNTEITGAGFYRLYVISVIKLTVSKHWIYYSLKHVKSTLNLLLPQQMVLEYLHSPDSWTILSHFLLQNNIQYIREALNDKKINVKGKLSTAVRHTPHRCGNSHATAKCDHSVTCHPAEMTFPHYLSRSWYSTKWPLIVGCKGELT